MKENPETGADEPDTSWLFVAISGARREQCQRAEWPVSCGPRVGWAVYYRRRTGWAVYYGPNSPNNSSGVIPDPMPQTLPFAEIQALKHALTSVRNLLSNDNPCSNVCIRTTSAYLKRMMLGDLPTCAQNDWKLGNGLDLEYAESWKCIHDTICDLQSVHGGQTKFCVQHVGGLENRGASRLSHKTVNDYYKEALNDANQT